MTYEPRQFPSPWRVEPDSETFHVLDGNGQNLVNVNFPAGEAHRVHTPTLTRDEARMLALNIARRPELMQATTGQPENVENVRIVLEDGSAQKTRRTDPVQIAMGEIIFYPSGAIPSELDRVWD